jgi:hypothetical protein
LRAKKINETIRLGKNWVGAIGQALPSKCKPEQTINAEEDTSLCKHTIALEKMVASHHLTPANPKSARFVTLLKFFRSNDY